MTSQDMVGLKSAGVVSKRVLIRIGIADDHAIMRQGLKHIFGTTRDLVVVGEAADAAEALRLSESVKLDILLLDMSMPGKSGTELIQDIRRHQPNLPILVFTMHEEEQYAVRAIRAGANGYFMKHSVSEELLVAVRKVAAGRPYISSLLAEKLALDVMPGTHVLPHQRLSKREYEIMQLLVSGKSITAVAHQLYLSVKTVSSHKKHILEKLGVRSFSDMIQYAVRNQLVLPLTH